MSEPHIPTTWRPMHGLGEALAQAIRDTELFGTGYIRVTRDGDRLIYHHLAAESVLIQRIGEDEES